MERCDGGDLGLGDGRDLDSARAHGERGNRRDLDGVRARGDLCDGRDLDGARARGDLGDFRDLDSARARGDLGDGRGTVDRIRSSLQHLNWNSTERGDHRQPSLASREKTARHDLQALRYADTQKQCTLSGFKKSMMTAVQTLESRLGGGSEMLRRVMSKVSNRIEAMEKDTLMVAAAVLDPYTHYVINLSNIPEFASALTVAIEKIADPDSAALAIYEISAFRERRGRFGQRVAHISAEKMSPTEWWFQFGGDVPNLQKYALRIVSQCVSTSGCERNWSAWALVHTKQRNRLLYGKLHKFVSVRHNLKIRAEEDKDRVRENDKYKEVDPCAMMMNTAMFDEANPMMEWLNEDEEHVILDGSDAASAVFEEIRRLNSSKKSSHLGRKGNGTKRKRVLEEDEDDYIDCDDDDEEDEYVDIDDEDECGDDSASEADGEDSTTRVEKDQPSQDGNEAEERNDGGLLNCRRSRRGKQSKKLKDLTSLYN